MARVKFIGIRETLTSLLPKAETERLARESGAMRRRHKVDPSAMFRCVVLGFGSGAERTMAGFVAPISVRRASRWCPRRCMTGSLPNSHGCFERCSRS